MNLMLQKVIPHNQSHQQSIFCYSHTQTTHIQSSHFHWSFQPLLPSPSSKHGMSQTQLLQIISSTIRDNFAHLYSLHRFYIILFQSFLFRNPNHADGSFSIIDSGFIIEFFWRFYYDDWSENDGFP